MARDIQRRAVAASLYAAIVLVVTALPGGLLLTAPNFVLVLSLFALTWTTFPGRARLAPLALATAGLSVASIPASSALLWWLGGGVDALGAIVRGPSVYISTAIALTAFTAATVSLRRAARRQSVTVSP